MSEALTILTGDCRALLKTLPDDSVQCCVTSPPYWGLRDYGMDGAIGLEASAEQWVAEMVAVFRQVRRSLRPDGTLWLNLGDSYTASGRGGDTGTTGLQGSSTTQDQSKTARERMANGSGNRIGNRSSFRRDRQAFRSMPHKSAPRLPAKNLLGLPWLAAFALQTDGWYLRSDIIWHKPNPMPESVTDRPTKSHEYIFLMSKNERYFYDAEAIKEPASSDTHARTRKLRATGLEKSAPTRERNGIRPPGVTPKSAPANNGRIRANDSWHASTTEMLDQRNKRSVWSVCTAPYREGHFATFPPDLIKPCILAGCPVGGLVLDPFAGSGTTGMVALELGRRAILIELNPEYVQLAQERTNVTPGLHLTHGT